MANKKILIIGAGLAQVDAIRRARELGYDVLASDGSDGAPGLKIADEFRVIDVKNIEQNLRWARQAHIEGVVCYASDITLPTVLAIREALKLPGLGRVPMEVSLDKAEQRRRFKKAGLPQPRFRVVDAFEDFEKAVREINLPLIVKPVDNAGSRGVTKVDRPEQLSSAFSSALENSKKKKVILEEYMEGTELTIEGFSVRGEHHILAISDKFKPEGSYRVATQLAYPADISAQQEQAVMDLIRAALKEADVDNTPTHSEIMMTEQGPKIIEIGCRGGGFYVFTRVVEAVCGYDIVGNWTRFCAGDPIEEIKVLKRGVVLRFYAAPSGRLTRVYGLEEANAINGVETELFLKIGDTVPELKTDGSRTGWMIVRAASRNEAVATADRVSQTVQFETEPC